MAQTTYQTKTEHPDNNTDEPFGTHCRNGLNRILAFTIQIFAMSELEQDFQKVAEQINLKVKEAADALREANRLASEAGLPALIYTQWTSDDDSSLDDLSEEERQKLEDDEEWDGESSPLKMKMDMIDVSDLEGELGDAGWSTSSSYC